VVGTAEQTQSFFEYALAYGFAGRRPPFKVSVNTAIYPAGVAVGLQRLAKLTRRRLFVGISTQTVAPIARTTGSVTWKNGCCNKGFISLPARWVG